MTPERWQQIERLFERVYEQPVDDRSRYLREAAGDDDALRQEVASLIATCAGESALLDQPALGGVTGVLDHDPADQDAAQLVGQRLGAYRVTRVIASGGMGTVLGACRDDAQFEKQVAIKVIRVGLGGMDARQRRDVTRRFQVERQVLAKLDHPHIARLLDGGTTPGGRPYYVMEYIEGQPIDRYCSTGALSVHDRLELFARVADAVQYAHQKLVIHRDLKPTNILVTPTGEPKLLDFGLAKPLDDSVAGEQTVGAGFMGTVHYAAPEQLMSTYGAVDTRTDVYALGLILYRLLTGRAPYPDNGTMSEVLQHVAETLPPRPSSIAPTVDDEVDTITLTALAKEQHRRYQSAGALQEDVRRYLAGEPILAKGDSHWYMLRKTARRFRVPLTLSAVLVALVIVFGISMAISAGRARDAERRAAASAASLAEALHFSNIERGRGAARTGNPMLAENCIWPEYLAPSPLTGIAAEGLHARWALRELYTQHPCVATLDFASPFTMVRLLHGSQRVAVLLSDGTIEVRALDGDRASFVLPDTTTPGAILDVSPDGRLLAHLGPQHAVVLLDTTTWHPSISLMHARSDPQWVRFSADGTHLVASTGQDILVWSIVDPTPRFTRSGRHHERAVAISPNGTRVACEHPPTHVDVYDVASGQRVSRFDDALRELAQVSFSPDGRLLATGGRDDVIRVYDLEHERLMTRIPHLSSFPRTMRMFETATGAVRLAAAGSDKVLHVWDAGGGDPLFVGAGHTAGIIEFDIDATGDHIVTCSGDRTVKLWDTAPQPGLRRLAGHGASVFSVAFDPRGPRLASSAAADDPTIKIWSTTTATVLRTLTGHRDAVSKVAFSPDGTVLASCGYDGRVCLWDPDTGDLLHTWSEHTGVINSLCFTARGEYLATAGDDGTIRLWDVTSRHPYAVLEQDTVRIPSVSVHPDGHTLVASGGYSRSIVLWDLATRTHREIPGHDLCSRAVQFSPDGQWLASSGDDHLIHLWAAEGRDTGTRIFTLEGHHRDVFALAFNRDGSILASGDRVGNIKLWETRSGRCLATLSGHADMVFAVAFSPDDAWLASGSRDERVGLWDLGYYDRHIAGNRAHHVARLERLAHTAPRKAEGLAP